MSEKEKDGAVARFQKAASDLLSRYNLASLAGLQFGGKRDLYAIFGYKSTLTAQDYLVKYTRQDIAKRIVNAPAVSTWRGHPKVDGGDAFNSAWEPLVRKHNLWAMFERLDKLAGLGQYAALLAGLSGSKLENPVVAGSALTELLYLQPYSELHLEILETVTDPMDARFGLPLMYQVEINQIKEQVGTGTKSTQKFKVHHSRMLHVAENILEDNVFGQPRLEHVYNLLDDLLKVVGGAAECFWLQGRQGTQFDVDKDMDLSPTDAANLEAEVENFQHQLRRTLRTRGVKVNTLGSDPPDPKSTFDVLMGLISGATGIPQRVLLGTEAGHLASEQDRANWAARIDERRIEYAEPQILIPFIDMLVVAGVLPEPKASDKERIIVEWGSAFTMSPLEEAQQSAQSARSAANLNKVLESKVPWVSPLEARRLVGLKDEVEGELPKPPPTPVPNMLGPGSDPTATPVQGDKMPPSANSPAIPK